MATPALVLAGGDLYRVLKDSSKTTCRDYDMARKIFGTDGVRGRANTGALTPGMTVKLASAVAQYFATPGHRMRVVIGKDPRRSGYMLEQALTAGFVASGVDVFTLGPMPTPAVGLLTHSMRADIGVMISASHNPYHDNGIKFFGPDGYKLSDEAEVRIEALMEQSAPRVEGAEIGHVTHLGDSRARYVEYTKTTVPSGLRLEGLKVVVDCANGAAYKVAPQVLWELGAEVVPLGVSPNGLNINENCGSMHPQNAAEAVVAHGADLGICLDGDADRIILIDETGHVADGDQIMALMATRLKDRGALNHNTLVATVMSNLGLERFLQAQDIHLKRTPVGDRYVVGEMRAGGFNLGGEQSGHIVMTDYATTGDGLVAALQFLAILQESGQKASQLAQQFTRVPQVLENVRYGEGKVPLETLAVQQAIAAGEKAMGDQGRILIRKSGTEPLIRVMGECEDEALLAQIVGDIAAAVKAAG